MFWYNGKDIIRFDVSFVLIYPWVAFCCKWVSICTCKHCLASFREVFMCSMKLFSFHWKKQTFNLPTCISQSCRYLFLILHRSSDPSWRYDVGVRINSSSWSCTKLTFTNLYWSMPVLTHIAFNLQECLENIRSIFNSRLM